MDEELDDDIVGQLKKDVEAARQGLEKAEQQEAEVAKSIKRVEKDQQDLRARIAEITRILSDEAAFNAVWEGLTDFQKSRHGNNSANFLTSLEEERSELKKDKPTVVEKEKDLRAKEADLRVVPMNVRQEFSALNKNCSKHVSKTER